MKKITITMHDATVIKIPLPKLMNIRQEQEEDEREVGDYSFNLDKVKKIEVTK